MTYDLVIQGGRLLGSTTAGIADVAVSGERIAAIGPHLTGAQRIDATGLYVLPGAIDGHVHMHDPSSASVPTADSFATGTRAAACGGVTTLIDFAESQPGEPLRESLVRRAADAEGQACIDYGLHMMLRDATGQHLDEIPELVAAGVPSFKMFMAWEDYRLTDVELLRNMEAVAACDGLAIVHAENEDVIQELRARLLTAGRIGARWHTATSPPATESEAIHRALALATLAGSRVLIFHISSRQGMREVTQAKFRGQSVYGEVCVQYLVLTDECYESDTSVAQSLMVRPPIRGRDHQAALWEALADGQADIVSTDHGPRTAGSDGGPHPSGTSSIELRLALLHSLGVRTGRLTPDRWVRACCTRPAEVFGLSQKGRLAAGLDADIVLFDPHKLVTISHGRLHSAIDYSTYEGVEVTGWPVMTISRGRVIVDREQFTGDATHGRFVEREPGPLVKRQTTHTINEGVADAGRA